MKNEAEHSGSRRLDMGGVKRALHRYNIRTKRAKRIYKIGVEREVQNYQSEE